MYNHGSDWNRDKGDFEIVTFMGNRAKGGHRIMLRRYGPFSAERGALAP
jgi:hypothetical protein